MRNIAYLTGLCFALACSSCNRDRLYYAMEEQGFVRLNVNWQPTQLNPNGMSVYVFDHENGKAIGKCQISSDPNTMDIALPVGKFDLLVINNTEEELATLTSPVQPIWQHSKPAWRQKKNRYIRTCFQKQKELLETPT